MAVQLLAANGCGRDHGRHAHEANAESEAPVPRHGAATSVHPLAHLLYMVSFHGWEIGNWVPAGHRYLRTVTVKLGLLQVRKFPKIPPKN